MPSGESLQTGHAAPHTAHELREIVRCPACCLGDVQSIYSLAHVPVQSTVLLPDAAAAAAYPTGELELCWCTSCGLAFNSRFDEGAVRYGDGYEDTQGSSPTFRRFASDLSRRWIERYDLHGKPALEIGCGKGEFLEIYCALSGGPGAGFDPAWDPLRQRADRAQNVRFYRERFDFRHAPFPAALIVCRHTLEHVRDVRTFVRLLRAACGEDRSVVVAIEVPALEKILEDRAFWDVYYEHASYFTAGALARLFRSAGFDVLALERVYGEQYLVLEARPATGGAAPPAAAEDTFETHAAVEAFRTAVPAAIAAWRWRFERWRSRSEKVVLWGSGSKAVGFLTTLGAAADVCAVVDINPMRHGRFMPGVPAPIVAPHDLPSLAPQHVIVMNPIYQREIEQELRSLALAPAIHTPLLDADRAPC